MAVSCKPLPFTLQLRPQPPWTPPPGLPEPQLLWRAWMLLHLGGVGGGGASRGRPGCQSCMEVTGTWRKKRLDPRKRWPWGGGVHRSVLKEDTWNSLQQLDGTFWLRWFQQCSQDLKTGERGGRPAASLTTQQNCQRAAAPPAATPTPQVVSSTHPQLLTAITSATSMNGYMRRPTPICRSKLAVSMSVNIPESVSRRPKLTSITNLV